MSKKAPFSELTSLSNNKLFEIVNAMSGNKFDNLISNGTNKLFTEAGCTDLLQNDIDLVNEFTGLMTKVVFQKFDLPRVKNKFVDSGLVETYDAPDGGVMQRIAGTVLPEITPRFTPEQMKSGNDNPFQTRFTQPTQRFFKFNDNYQNMISFQDFPYKQAFVAQENGIGLMLSEKMNALQLSYELHNEAFILKVLMSGITNKDRPLQETQKIGIDWSDNPTDEQYRAFIETIMDVMSVIDDSWMTGDFNQNGYKSSWSPDDFVMFVRNPIKNRIRTRLMVGAYNPDDLAIPISRVNTVNDWGGLEPYSDAEFQNRLYPVYDSKWGNVVDGYYTTTAGGDKVDCDWLKHTPTDTSNLVVDDGSNVFWKDPYDDVLAVIAQKGLVFRGIQNGYQIRAIQNPANLVDNYWASAPNNAVNYDSNYNVIVITKNSAS